MDVRSAPPTSEPLGHRLAGDLDRVRWAALGPGDAAIVVDLAYGAVLGRAADRDALEAATAALESGTLTRHQLVRNLVDSQEFTELALVEELTMAARSAPTPFDVDPAGVGPATSERVVEVPWSLSRYRGERRVLDVGYAHAPTVYLAQLLALGIPELHGVDMATRTVPLVRPAAADVRRLPYRTGAFDLVLCISTLEHVGHDNSQYGLPMEKEKGDVEALLEMARVLAPGGRLVVTVPVGHPQDFGWFAQYGVEQWPATLAATPFAVEEEAVYRLGESGWVRAPDLASVADARYGVDCPGARAVLCAVLIRP